MRNYLQDWKEWKGVLGILDVESSKLVVFPPRELPIKTQNEVIRSSLKEKKVSKDQSKDRNAWKSFKGNSPTHVSMENQC